MRAGLGSLERSVRYRRPPSRLPWPSSGQRRCPCAVGSAAQPGALIKPLWKALLSSTRERSEEDAGWSENDDYSRAFVGLGSWGRALTLHFDDGEGFCLGKAGSGEQKPWFRNMPALLRPGLTLWVATGKLPGSPTRLPGGLPSSPGYRSKMALCLPSIGLVELHVPSGSPSSPWPQTAPLVGYRLPWLPSPHKGWAPTCSLPRSPSAHVYVSMCVTLPMGLSKGHFSKNSYPRENSHFWLFIRVWNE